MKYAISFFLVILIVGCFSSKTKLETRNEPQINFTKVQLHFPGYTTEDFSKGANLNNSYCKACHNSKDPLKYSEAEWKMLVPSMSAKSNKNLGTKITKEDEELIYKYIVAVQVGSSK